MRDITKKQFDAACKKWGFEPIGFMGYYRLPKPYDNTLVCKFNAGKRRRAQLAYLIRSAEKAEREAEKRHNGRMTN